MIGDKRTSKNTLIGKSAGPAVVPSTRGAFPESEGAVTSPSTAACTILTCKRHNQSAFKRLLKLQEV